MKTAQKKQNDRFSELCILDQVEPADLIGAALKEGFNHLVQKNQPETMREIRSSRVISRNPDVLLHFPVSCALNPRKAGPEMEKELTLRQWTLNNRVEKSVIINEIRQLFDQSRLCNQLTDDVVLAADEFMCNVLFNAVHKNGVNPLGLPESIQLANQPLRHPALIRIGAFGGSLAIACRDLYGTLDPKRLLERLKDCYDKGAGVAMRFDDTGTAGIGTYMVFTSCTSLYMAVKSGVSTQVCAVFPVKLSSRVRRGKPKNLHWIEYPGG